MRIIENRAYLAYRNALDRISRQRRWGISAPNCGTAFALHLNDLETGAMLADLNVVQFGAHPVPAADNA